MGVTHTAKQALRAAGFYRHRLHANPYRGVAVLAYHGVRANDLPASAMHFENLHVTAARLASHCACLRALGCALLSFDEWQRIARGDRPVPERAVLVTFDDGYRNVLTCGVPVLERYAIPAVVFVCTGPVERGVRFWFDAVASRSGEDEVERAKALDHRAWRELADRFEVAATAADPHAPLTIDELRRLAAHPLVTIGAHTASHPILARAPVAAQREEIAASRRTLERWIGSSVTAFAYPNGRPAVDFTSQTVSVVREAGFTHAFTTAAGFADPGVDPLEHPRFLMLDSVDASELAHRLAISWPRDESEVSCRAV
jgi:peptidoglycan/xylan/chitin deacetylase (PgdA/CDA1 family)